MTDTATTAQALRAADKPREILAGMELEQLKPLAREICGIKKIHPAKDPKAQADGLRGSILRALSAEKALQPTAPQLGDTLTDEESGEQVKITAELAERVHELFHRLQQAEYSVQAGLVEICRVVKDFRDERAYLFFGYTSFRKFCDAGQLKILGQTRSRDWAYRQIKIIESLGEKVVARVQQLPQRQLLKLSQILNSAGMESTLEELREKHQLRYTGPDGQEVVLKVPEEGGDFDGWREVIETMHHDRALAKQSELDAEETLVTEREEGLREKGELLDHIKALEEKLQTASGRTEEMLDELEQAKTLTPEQIAQAQIALKESRGAARRLEAELRASREQLEGLAGQIEKRRRLAADGGTLRQAREYCEQAIRRADQSIEAVSPLRAMGADLPEASRQLLHDTAVRCESQFRRLADEMLSIGEGE